MTLIFQDIDLSVFWAYSDYAQENYVEPPPTASEIAAVEAEVGVRLPASYIELMQSQNGGFPVNCSYPTATPTSWAPDHISITGIIGIGRQKSNSLCGSSGNKFMQEEWGYPEIGIYICDCPSAGHDIIMLDYRNGGPQGEPEVVHVDQELDYATTFLARDFESFVRGLVHDSVYEDG